MAEDKKVNEEQKKELDDLQKQIEAEQAKVNDLQKKVDEQRKLKEEQGKKNKELSQYNAALNAKKQWIEKTYNYSDNVEQMKTTYFSQIIETNKDVNTHVETFQSKLGNVQKELLAIKAKNSFGI